MKIIDVQVSVTCPAGQTYTLIKSMTDQGVYGVGEGTKNGREPAVAALMKVCTGSRDLGLGIGD